MGQAFLTTTGAFLPGPPIENDAIEAVLGALGEPSRLRARILRANGIQRRHYAIGGDGRPTHTTAALAAEAGRDALARRGLAITDVDVLACATSIPEHLMPGHASSVHGELGGHALEIASLHGVCGASVGAIKYAAMAVQSGSRRALVTTTERTSLALRAGAFTAELRARTEAEEADPFIGFDQEFLRWMLSDGGSAAIFEPEPLPGRLSFAYEWGDFISFAHALPSCMYMGGEPQPDGRLMGWRDGPSMGQALRTGQLNIHQDVKLLGKNIVETCARSLAIVRERRGLSADQVDWILPHYSSEFFREKMVSGLAGVGFPVPDSRWYTNLTTRGNTGCASPLMMLHDFVELGMAKPGDRVLLMVPESGRFACGWISLRAV